MSRVRRVSLLVAVVTILATGIVPAWGASAPPTLPLSALLKLTPEDLQGSSIEELHRQAQEAYTGQRYADAAQAYVRILRVQPQDQRALYNLACTYGLLGAAEPAARFLLAAWNAGYRDLDSIQADGDFERVRHRREFRKVLEHLRTDALARRRQAGEVIEVPGRVLAAVRVSPPDELQDGQRYPLVVGLHGAGGTAEDFVRLFTGHGVRQPFFFAVPQGPYTIDAGGRPGFVWYRRLPGIRRGVEPHSRQFTEAFLLDVVDEVAARYPVDRDRVFLMGFSQGAFMSFSLGLRHPERFRGVIPVGGWVGADELPGDALTRAAETGIRFLICHSPEERVVAFNEAEAAISLLQGHQMAVELHRYPGGHVLTPELAKHAATWIAKVSAAPLPPMGQDGTP